MGQSLSLMELEHLIHHDVGLQPKCVHLCSLTEQGSTVSCMVPRSWYNNILKYGRAKKVPSEWPPVCDLDELRIQLTTSAEEPDCESWAVADAVKVCVKVVTKCSSDIDSVPKVYRTSNSNSTMSDSFSAYLCYKASDSEARQWEALKKRLHNEKADADKFSKTKSTNASITSDYLQFALAALGRPCARFFRIDSSEEANEDEDVVANEDSTIVGSALARPSLRSGGGVSSVDFVLESSTAFFIFSPYQQHNLENVLMYSPKLLSSSNAKPLFIIFQILQALRRIHDNGVTHGRLSPKNVLLDSTMWVTIAGIRSSSCTKIPRPLSAIENASPESYSTMLQAWVEGWISNYDYLMGINRLAGRSMADPAHHPILPWIVDFSSPSGGWRDFTRSKYRLNKGDQQLDFTYENAGSGDLVKHHVSDILSEITYFVYHARKTPKKILCQHVRSNWVPEEYPSSMERLYEWTPDECIPAFFTDPGIFNSIHDDLPALGLPEWTQSPEEFVDWHMNMLESDYVSSKLHHWIDLNFGFKLSGRAAVEAKNVVLGIAEPKTRLCGKGIVQLFKLPHPARASTPAPVDPASRPSTSPAEYDRQKFGAAATPLGQSRTPSNNTALLFGPDSALGKLFPKKSQADTQSDKNPHGKAIPLERDRQSPQQGGLGSKSAFAGAHAELNRMLEGRVAAKGFSVTPSRTGADDADPSRSSSTRDVTGAHSMNTQRHRIPLPQDFRPTRSVVQVESINSFLQVVEGVRSREEPANAAQVNTTALTDNSLKSAIANDMRSVGCIAAELFLSEFTATWLARSTVSNNLRFQEQHLAGLLRKHSSAIPLCVRNGVLRLVDNNPSERPTTQELLFSKTPTPLFAFPKYFDQLYNFVSEFKNEQDLKKRPQIVEKWLKFITSLSEAGLSLALPIIKELFQIRESQKLALDFFDAIGRRLGSLNCCRLLRVPLFEMHETAADNPPLLAKLFSKRIVMSFVARFGMEVYIDNFLQFLIDGVTHASDMVARAAIHGLSAATKLFGPVLAGRLVVRPILRQLNKAGGIYPVAALSMIIPDLGSELITKVYLPYLQTNMDMFISKMGPKSEYFMRNVALLLRRTLGQFSSDQLADMVEELVATIFQPMLQCLVSVHGSFPNGMRPVLTRLYIELVMCTSRSIGRDISQKCLRSTLELFFSAFDWIHATPLMNPTPLRMTRARTSSGAGGSPEVTEDSTGDAQDLSVLAEAFDVNLAAFAYSNFCQLIGQETMRRFLYNSSLVEQLMYDAEPAVADVLPQFIPSQLSMYGENSLVLKSDVEVFDGIYDETLGSPNDRNSVKQLANVDQGGWLSHLDNQISSKARFPPINFQHVHVESYGGHTSSIKAAVVFNNERSIVTGSRDKTVKIWSVNHGKTMEDSCRRTYLGHRKGVFEVIHVARSGHITSCDGTIHVWDPENGYRLRQYEFRRNPAVALGYITERNALIAGTTESTLKLLDVRAGQSVNEWRPSSANHGTIKSVVVDETSSWAVVGFTSGLVSLLDVRTGLLLYCWRAHESDVTKIKPLSNQRFLTSSTDHAATLWGWGTHDSIVAPMSRFKGGNEPLVTMDTYKDKLYLVSSNSRVMSYENFDNPNEMKVSDRPRKVKGMKGHISTINILPMNQLVLLGSESGSLSLYR